MPLVALIALWIILSFVMAPIIGALYHGEDRQRRRMDLPVGAKEPRTRGNKPPVKMTWYDGGNVIDKTILPPDLLPESGQVPISGSLIIGDKGKLYTPGDYGGGGHIIDGVEVGDVQVFPWGSFVFFSDPDGNRWAVQQVQARE